MPQITKKSPTNNKDKSWQNKKHRSALRALKNVPRGNFFGNFFNKRIIEKELMSNSKIGITCSNVGRWTNHKKPSTATTDEDEVTFFNEK